MEEENKNNNLANPNPIDDKEAQKAKNNANNSKALKTAGKAAATYYGGALGNQAANTLLSDDNAIGRSVNKNIVDPMANKMTNKLKGVPGAQSAVNQLSESGAVDAVDKAVDASAGSMSSAGNNAKAATQSAAQTDKVGSAVESSDSLAGLKEAEQSSVSNMGKGTNLLLNKNIIIIIIALVAALLSLLVLMSAAVYSGSDNTAVQMNKYVLSEQETEEYKVESDEDYELTTNKDGFLTGIWGDETSKVFEGQEQFFRRYRAIYFEYRLFHPWLNKNKLTATRLHLLSTLFLDYSPETFNEDINKYSVSNNPSEVDDAYGEGNGYKVCSEDYTSNSCSGEVLEKEDYIFTSLDAILKRGKSEAAYTNEQDSTRKLMRNFLVYVGKCDIKCTTSCNEGESGCVCRNNECTKTETDIKYYDKLTFWQMIKIIFGFAPNPYKEDCNSYKSSTCSTSFGFVEEIDFCSYYEYLAESDYFEKHKHFSDLFVGMNDVEKLEEKKILIKDIIDIAYETDESDPIYTWQSVNDDYTNYTLASSMYITVQPDANGENGGSYSIDEYVAGVLMDEVGFFYHYRDDYGFSDTELLEAWKAMAVAIRSYTLSRTKGGTKSIANSSGAQNFTAAYLNSNTKQALLAKQAASQTQNQVLLLNGDFFSAEYDSFYKKTTGGTTSSGGFKCENDFCSVTYLKKGSNSNKVYHQVFVPVSWKGKLYGGHGRGMSQWAALYQATEGKSYTSILSYFYANEVKLSNVNFSSGESIEVDTGTDTSGEEDNVYNPILPMTLGGSSVYEGEAVQTCKYDIKIPVRLMGVKSVSYDEETGELVEGDESETPVTGDFGEIIKGSSLVVNARQFIGKTREQMASLLDTSGSWCAKFVSYIFSITSGTGVSFNSSSVSSWASYFQGNNSYYHSNYWAKANNNPSGYNKYRGIATAGGPKVGDIIIFSATACGYDGSGNLPSKSGDCFRHIGIVTGVSGNTVTYTHGNTTSSACGGKNGVCENSTSLENPYIVGFGRWE